MTPTGPGPETGADRLRRLVAERNREQVASRRPPLTPDQVYIDAVWDSALPSTQKITALCYGNHARNFPERDRAWVVYQRLMPQTGIRSRETVAKVHAELTAAGWLEPAGHRPGHKQITVYRLALPPRTSTDIGTGAESGTGTDNRTGTDSGADQYGFPPDQFGNPNRTGSESGTRPSLLDPPKDPPKAPSQRGTRVPEDFAVTPAMRTWWREHAPDVDIAIETALFLDHWRAENGAKAIKRDWVAAWRKWLGNQQKWKTERGGSSRSNGTPRPNGHQTYRDPDRAAYYQGSL